MYSTKRSTFDVDALSHSLAQTRELMASVYRPVCVHAVLVFVRTMQVSGTSEVSEWNGLAERRLND